MYISELRVKNFRNFLNSKFVFNKGVNTLIGENGSGKTNALYALRILLDESLARNSIYLRDTDFCRALDNWHGHWIIISIDFEELDPSEGCQLLKHSAGHMDETDTGTYNFYFRPKLEVRTKLYEMSEDGTEFEVIQEYLNTITVDEYEPVFTGRATAEFLDDEIYNQIVGDFTSLVFPNPNDDDQLLLGVRTGQIHPEITCTFAQALRDVISDLRGYRSNPLLALLRGTESTIQINDANKIISTVATLNKDISSLPEIKNIANGVQNTLYATVGHTYSPSVNVESALPDKLEKLLQRLTITVGDNSTSKYSGELSEQSLGGANLIYLALKLLEYEVKLSSDRVAHFLLIEEPEAHIHTHIQKTLFENQSAHKTQVIVSTHSTHISSAAKIQSVNVLTKQQDHAEVYQPSNGLDEIKCGRIERYLDAVRSTLLFAKGVILVEGEAELIMIPAMIKAVFGVSPDEIGISIISMNSAFFEHIAVIFHNDRIQKRCAIVTDLDKSLIELPEDAQKDNEEEKHARASQESGQTRYNLINEFIKDNQWLKAFFADNTFETDFLATNNVREACETVNTVYKNAAWRIKLTTDLKNEDSGISGQAILKLAKKVGKGWYALLLSEKLHADTFIPSYILRAIAFAADAISVNAIKRIGLFRINNDYFNKDIRKQFPNNEELKLIAPEEFIKLYKTKAPNDDLTELLNYLEEYKH